MPFSGIEKRSAEANVSVLTLVNAHLGLYSYQNKKISKVSVLTLVNAHLGSAVEVQKRQPFSLSPHFSKCSLRANSSNNTIHTKVGLSPHFSKCSLRAFAEECDDKHIKESLSPHFSKCSLRAIAEQIAKVLEQSQSSL